MLDDRSDRIPVDDANGFSLGAAVNVPLVAAFNVADSFSLGAAVHVPLIAAVQVPDALSVRAHGGAHESADDEPFPGALAQPVAESLADADARAHEARQHRGPCVHRVRRRGRRGRRAVRLVPLPPG